MIRLILDNKGQASAELILVTVVFLVVAMGLISLSNSEMNKVHSGDLAHARMIGESMAETINTVYINGPGYSANFTLQNLSNSPGYTVYVYNNTGNINIIYLGNNITIKLIPLNVTSNSMMTNGTTHLVTNNKGNITIK